MNRRAMIMSAAVMPGLFASRGRSQSFPSRIIRLVVPYPAGGPTDAVARIVAQDLTATFRHNVLVENIAGASGAIGARLVAKAEPDGHTIIFGNDQSHGNNMLPLKAPGYDAVRDFVPLVGVGAFEHVFVADSSLTSTTLTDVVAMARREPERLTFGSTGLGSGSRLSMSLLAQRTAIRLTHVPFRGASQLVQELIAGRLDIANAPLPSVLGGIQGRQIAALEVASPRRNRHVPDVATLDEQGIAGANAESWAGFFAPAKDTSGARYTVV